MKYLLLFILFFNIHQIYSQHKRISKSEYSEKIFNQYKNNVSLNNAFLRALDTNLSVKNEFDKSMYYKYKYYKSIGISGLGYFFGLISLIGLTSKNLDVRSVFGVASAGLISTGIVFGIESGIRNKRFKKHYKQSYKLAGLECPCNINWR